MRRFAERAPRILLPALVVFALWPLPERARRPAYSRVIAARDGSLLQARLSSDEKWRLRVDMDALPAHLTQGLICLEDRRFHWHPGVDPLAALRALSQNRKAGRVVSGASTLTMQVARLLDPKPRRWSAKLSEAVLAARLELQLSKRRILELYLTYAPFGGNVEGLEAAAQRYFAKSARELAPGESAFLLLLPQAPRRWVGRESGRLSVLRDRVLERWRGCGVIGAEEAARARAVPIPRWRAEFDEHAPHFARWMADGRRGERLVTTVDPALQRALEELVASGEARWRELGVRNIGVVAVENATGAVRAAIGNFDARRDGDAQSFASFLVPRSTGSLLKPFLFARLIESGELLPESLVEDVPIELNGYRPENYSGEFLGLIEARLALAHSLNVPWIRALRDHGVDAFYSFLLSSGVKTPQRAADVGVSMVVGGLQLSLLDLVALYRALADDGRMRELRLLEGDAGGAWSWMNPAAVHLTREALKIRGRPDFALDPSHLANPSLRWKTGTSQGNKDAWAVAFDPEWTIGVWLGNLDQSAAPALVGPELAAPVAFDGFSRLRSRGRMEEWSAVGTETVEVCAFSGLPATDACPQRKTVVGVKGLAMRKRCPYHRHILVDALSGRRITRECERPGMRPQVRSGLELSAEAMAWTLRQSPGLELTPPFHPACAIRPAAAGGGVKILSPEAKTYIVHSAESRSAPGGGLAMPLRLRAQGGGARCFLNGKRLESPSGEMTLLRVPAGTHRLLCADELGRADEVEFSVEL